MTCPALLLCVKKMRQESALVMKRDPATKASRKFYQVAVSENLLEHNFL
jgi:hypothetical protein